MKDKRQPSAKRHRTNGPDVKRLSNGAFVEAKEPLPKPPQTGRFDEREMSSGSVIYMTSTEAKNEFGRVLDAVGRNGTVVISRRNTNKAVVMSVQQYEELTGRASSVLDTLTAEFDELLERMQAPVAIDAMLAAFRASPEELGRAAVSAARQNGT